MVVCGGVVVMFGVPIVTQPFVCDFLNLLCIILIPHFRKVNKFVVTVCTCGITPVLLVCTYVLSRLFSSFYASAVFRARTIRQSCDKHRKHSVRAQYYLECVFNFIVILLAAK